MRNFKNTFITLLLISLFSCNTQSITEDESPDLAAPASSKFQEVTPPDSRTLTINITVRYPENWDKAITRAEVGALLGLQSWSSCSARGDAEIWTIVAISEARFNELLLSFNVHPTSIGSLGSTDPYAERDSTMPVFIYGNLCQ